MTTKETSESPGSIPEGRRTERQREGVRRGELLLHTGVLDIVSAVALLIAMAVLATGVTGGGPGDSDPAPALLGAGAFCFLVRGGVRALTFAPAG